MYTRAWLKFLPLIRLMLKRSQQENQVVKMDRMDFDKAGGGKKVGYSFIIEFRKGRVYNQLTSQIAKDLVPLFQEDEVVMAILKKYNATLEMNPKCELTIKLTEIPVAVEAV